MRNNTAAKIIATLIVLVVAFIYMDRNNLFDPVVEAWEFAKGDSVPVDNPIDVDFDIEGLVESVSDIEIGGPAEVDYDREGQFGRDWALDFDGNGCDTRNDILARDLQYPLIDDDGCTVLTGLLQDPFTGDHIDFTHGVDTSAAVQIDHIVPLRWAAAQGALDWDEQTREEFANDPINLLAVDGPTNEAKGANGPGDWMPPNSAFHCDYAAAFVNVVQIYDLTMPAHDLDAAHQTLQRC
ncbi:HNH endonuclease family protein [Pseudactinotalea sp. Z1748]|uniref:HNH endonuclease family protein n=1 Tax=Pseudactinotalea sp. Z1748 TaxID=3413027 RepID=UPI003C7CE60F